MKRVEYIMDVIAEKKCLRASMKRLRDDLELTEFRSQSNAVSEKLIKCAEWQRAQSVHIYVSAVNNEVDTLGLIFRLFDEGCTVVVPVCDHAARTLKNVCITSMDQLIPCRFGLMEPEYSPDKEYDERRLDLVVAPLLAFDRTGGRLGFGGGFYDSLLANISCPAIGLAYDFQEVETVPAEQHDRPLSMIVTDKEVIRVGNT